MFTVASRYIGRARRGFAIHGFALRLPTRGRLNDGYAFRAHHDIVDALTVSRLVMFVGACGLRSRCYDWLCVTLRYVAMARWISGRLSLHVLRSVRLPSSRFTSCSPRSSRRFTVCASPRDLSRHGRGSRRGVYDHGCVTSRQDSYVWISSCSR